MPWCHAVIHFDGEGAVFQPILMTTAMVSNRRFQCGLFFFQSDWASNDYKWGFKQASLTPRCQAVVHFQLITRIFGFLLLGGRGHRSPLARAPPPKRATQTNRGTPWVSMEGGGRGAVPRGRMGRGGRRLEGEGGTYLRREYTSVKPLL